MEIPPKLSLVPLGIPSFPDSPTGLSPDNSH